MSKQGNYVGYNFVACKTHECFLERDMFCQQIKLVFIMEHRLDFKDILLNKLIVIKIGPSKNFSTWTKHFVNFKYRIVLLWLTLLYFRNFDTLLMDDINWLNSKNYNKEKI